MRIKFKTITKTKHSALKNKPKRSRVIVMEHKKISKREFWKCMAKLRAFEREEASFNTSLKSSIRQLHQSVKINESQATLSRNEVNKTYQQSNRRKNNDLSHLKNQNHS
mmetsp:Transcript_13069/g.15081  ORF Transcript_13069/g.15081 Transcript_13069/m.15081 type:complete len:109 (+) Transcript_13069:1463-1789(+)